MTAHCFPDPDLAVQIMVRRGYTVVSDRASGTLLTKDPGRFVSLLPDGEAEALAAAPGPCWRANCELAESADWGIAR